MTKKSYSRQKRDAEMKDARNEVAQHIKGNKIYDDIKDLYSSCGATIVTYANSYNELKVEEVLPHMQQEQQEKVKTLITGYHQDTETLIDDLVKINAPFKGKTGGEPSVDAFLETVGVVDQYQEFIGRAKGLLDPTFRALAAEVEVTRQLIDSQNQDVVTDVEAKEAAQ
jgi:hypothetical protein